MVSLLSQTLMSVLRFLKYIDAKGEGRGLVPCQILAGRIPSGSNFTSIVHNDVCHDGLELIRSEESPRAGHINYGSHG